MTIIPFGGARTRGLEYALLRAAGRFGGRRPYPREATMSLGTILIIILIIFLLGGYSGRFGGYGYGYGHSGMGLGGVILIVLVILVLLGKF
jgi:ABC-type tungstate transport system substrate-binding protein